MKEHKKELIIIESNTNYEFTTAKILYNKYKIGTLELQVNTRFPSFSTTQFLRAATTNTTYNLPFKPMFVGEPTNTQYIYINF